MLRRGRRCGPSRLLWRDADAHSRSCHRRFARRAILAGTAGVAERAPPTLRLSTIIRPAPHRMKGRCAELFPRAQRPAVRSRSIAVRGFFPTARNLCLSLHDRVNAGDWVLSPMPTRFAAKPSSISRETSQAFRRDTISWMRTRGISFNHSISTRPSSGGWRSSGSNRRCGGREACTNSCAALRARVLPYRTSMRITGTCCRRGGTRKRAGNTPAWGNPGSWCRKSGSTISIRQSTLKIPGPLCRGFRGEHPPAARPVVEQLRQEYAPEYARAAELAAAAQPPLVRARNMLMKLG